MTPLPCAHCDGAGEREWACVHGSRCDCGRTTWRTCETCDGGKTSACWHCSERDAVTLDVGGHAACQECATETEDEAMTTREAVSGATAAYRRAGEATGQRERTPDEVAADWLQLHAARLRVVCTARGLVQAESEGTDSLLFKGLLVVLREEVAGETAARQAVGVAP